MGPTRAVSFLMLPSATFNDVTLLVSFTRCGENPYLILILLVKAAHKFVSIDWPMSRWSKCLSWWIIRLVWGCCGCIMTGGTGGLAAVVIVRLLCAKGPLLPP